MDLKKDPDPSSMDVRTATEFHLARPGHYLPTLDKLKSGSIPSTSEVNESISSARKRYVQDLEALFESQAERHLQDALDLYVAYNDSEFRGTEDLAERAPEPPASATAVMETYQRKRTAQRMHFCREMDDLILANASTMISLQSLKSDSEQGYQSVQDRHLAFPQTIAEYRALPNADKKRAVARFLVDSKKSPRDSLIQSQQGWSWRAAHTLLEAYYLHATFALEVQEFVKTFDVTDPRRRPPAH